MSRFLIAYESRHGQTEKIANFIGERLILAGHSYDLIMLNKLSHDTNPRYYQGVIVGAPIYARKVSSKVKRWLLKNREAIQQKPSAFFSVCLGVLQEQPEVQLDEVQIVRGFLKSCGWNPQIVSIFAGALTYSKYNWVLKLLMRYISRKAGVMTSTSADYEYTDWIKVDEFVQQFLRNASSAQPSQQTLSY